MTSTRDDPDAPCRCGSGLPYGECHQEINEAAPDQLLGVAHRAYARRWRGNASSYQAQGLYERLAGQLFSRGRPSARILDLGCGRGEGMDALRARMPEGGLLLGIDENPSCLEAAAGLLGVAVPPQRLRRAGGGSGRNYTLEDVGGGPIPANGPITLVQSDLLRDDEALVDALEAVAPFDAATMWFAGSHPARQYDLQVQRLGITGDRMLRQAMELCALEHACALVREGGHLQIVGRGVTNEPAYLECQIREEMTALSTRGAVRIVDIRLERYEEPLTGERIGVADPRTQVPAGCRTYAASTLFEVMAS